MKRIFLVSPIAEFHRWVGEVTPRNMKILDAQFIWVKGILANNGYEVKTSLDISEIPFKGGKTTLTTTELSLLFRSKTWENLQIEREVESVKECDWVVLMLECHQVESSHVRRVEDLAKKEGKKILNVEDILPIDSGDFRKHLMEIEKTIMESRNRRKLLMKGGRQR